MVAQHDRKMYVSLGFDAAAMGFAARGDGKPVKQQLLSDRAAPPYLRRAVAVHARQANHQHIQRRTADR